MNEMKSTRSVCSHTLPYLEYDMIIMISCMHVPNVFGIPIIFLFRELLIFPLICSVYFTSSLSLSLFINIFVSKGRTVQVLQNVYQIFHHFQIPKALQ